MNISRPEQRLLLSKKNQDWKEKNVIYWCGRTNLYPVVNSDALVLYAAAAGKMDESVYTYVTNPLNTNDTKLKGYPAKMRNIDILSGNIQTLLGELSERLFNPMVIAINSNIESLKEEKEYELLLQQLKQEFVNNLVKEGLAPQEIAQTPLSDDIIKKTVSNIKDQLALMGQQGLDVILKDSEVDLIRRKTLYDFIVLARMFTYRDIQYNDIVYNWVSPLEISFTNTPNVDFIEDCEAVKRAVTLPMSEIMDIFSDNKDFQKILPELELRIGNVGYQSVYTGITTDMLKGDMSQPFTTQTEGLMVEHINWTSMKMMKRVTGKDVFGNFYKEDYDETYIALDTEEVEEYWVNEKWEGYRIDGQHILGVQPIEFQRGTYNNPNKCKNLYNGRIFMNNYIIPQSIIEKGIVYQIKYNIIHYHLEKIIAKNKDKIMTIPLGIIPQKEGWDEFTMMYYADAHGYLFMDETNPQTMQAMQYMKSIDMGLTQYIKEMYGILRQIKEDWDESVGISRQRKGQNMASDGKAVNEEAIYRSSVISEEFFKQHEETIIRDLQCLLDFSKVAWANGKKGAYVNSDMKEVYYNLDPTVYPFSEHGIYVENSTKATKELQMMKQQLGNVAQQSNQIGLLPRIARATNMSKLIEEIDAIEAKFNEQQQGNVQAEQQLKAEEVADKEKDRQLKIYEIDENNDTKKYIAVLQAQAQALSFQMGEEGTVDAVKIQELAIKQQEIFRKIDLEQQKLEESKQKRMDDVKIARENMVNDLEIAKKNASNRGAKK
jgi:hypothetical protein